MQGLRVELRRWAAITANSDCTEYHRLSGGKEIVMSGILDEVWQQHIASSVAHWSEMAKAAIDSAAAQYERPCVLFKPRLSVDGNQWCALYGDSLQDGVAGFGDSPADAMWDFDRNWGAKLPTQEARRKAETKRNYGLQLDAAGPVALIDGTEVGPYPVQHHPDIAALTGKEE